MRFQRRDGSILLQSSALIEFQNSSIATDGVSQCPALPNPANPTLTLTPANATPAPTPSASPGPHNPNPAQTHRGSIFLRHLFSECRCSLTQNPRSAFFFLDDVSTCTPRPWDCSSAIALSFFSKRLTNSSSRNLGKKECNPTLARVHTSNRSLTDQ